MIAEASKFNNLFNNLSEKSHETCLVKNSFKETVVKIKSQDFFYQIKMSFMLLHEPSNYCQTVRQVSDKVMFLKYHLQRLYTLSHPKVLNPSGTTP